MRHARASRRGISRGVQRHTIGNRGGGKSSGGANKSSDLKSRRWLYSLLEEGAKSCFHKSFNTCSKLCLIQLVHLKGFRGGDAYSLGPIWLRIFHPAVILLVVASIARNVWLTWRRLERVGTDVITAICLCGSWVSLGAFLIALGVLIQPAAKTTELLNSWSTILNLHTRIKTVWNDPVVCIQVIAVSTGQVLYPTLFPFLGITLPGIPIFFLPSMFDSGIINAQGMVEHWLWWAMLYPFEVIIFGTPVLLLGFTCQILVVQVGIFKAMTREIR